MHDYSLDENGLLKLRLEPAGHGAIKATLFSDFSRESTLVKNLLPLISVATNNGAITPTTSEFTIPAQANDSISLKINNQPFAKFLGTKAVESHRKLSVFETRIIGRAAQRKTPDHRDLQNAPTLITDLHTHLSGQISSADLLEIGKKHKIFYPTAALDKLGIFYPKDQLRTIPKRKFLPLAHLQDAGADTEMAVPLNELLEKNPNAKKALENAMSLSPENQSTFEEMEMAYYLREPFTKNVKLLPEILHKIAEAYDEQKIEYAELSSNAVIDPEWLKVIHDTLTGPGGSYPGTNVKLRFLAGLMRNLTDSDLGNRIEKIKLVAKSPFVVGVDILGYETNKTSHLNQHLEKLAAWMRDYQPDMVLRIHAGENAKNMGNVKECLQLADKYKIRLRIGHAVYGIDDETIGLAKELAKENRLIIEFNPDSNLAVNNVDFADEIPINTFIKKNIPSVLSSDGAGLYLTSARQTAMAGLLCDVSHKDFDFIHDVEQKHINEQMDIFEKKNNLPADFFESLSKAMPKDEKPKSAAGEKPAPADPKPLSFVGKKHPIFIGGGSGSSWDGVDGIQETDRENAVRGLRLLLNSLDPKEVCFVTGRTKDTGIGIELGKAIADYNASHGKKFDCALMVAEGQNDSIPLPVGFSHKMELQVPLAFLAHAALHFIKEHEGMAYYVGGKKFTRDFILESMKQDVPFGLMDGVKGASSEKARIFDDPEDKKKYIFKDAIGMAKHAAAVHPELFGRDTGRPAGLL